jgi:hypothetical protein
MFPYFFGACTTNLLSKRGIRFVDGTTASPEKQRRPITKHSQICSNYIVVPERDNLQGPARTRGSILNESCAWIVAALFPHQNS